jgi:hypothetical protein
MASSWPPAPGTGRYSFGIWFRSSPNLRSSLYGLLLRSPARSASGIPTAMYPS